MSPSAEVLAAFGATEPPVAFDGGQGWTCRSGDIVLKPVGLAVEAEWSGCVYASLRQEGFTVPRPVQAAGGGYVAQGWAAWEHIHGEHPPVGRFAERFDASRAFHHALLGVEEPGFFKDRFDPWSIADRRVWGTADWRANTQIGPLLAQLERLYEPVDGPWQIVHGDMAGNVIFRPDAAPAVIDFSPYWAPQGFGEAVMVVDMVMWEAADFGETLDLCQVAKPLVARAAARRLLEVDTHHTLRGRVAPPADEIAPYLKFLKQLID